MTNNTAARHGSTASFGSPLRQSLLLRPDELPRRAERAAHSDRERPISTRTAASIIVFTAGPESIIRAAVRRRRRRFRPAYADDDPRRPPAIARRRRLQQRRPRRHRRRAAGRSRSRGCSSATASADSARRQADHRGAQVSVGLRATSIATASWIWSSAGNGIGAIVTVLCGNGNGTFQSPAADRHGDRTHRASSSTTSTTTATPTWRRAQLGSVSVMLGNGSGGLPGANHLRCPVHLRVRKVGDLNGDGFKDLVVGYQPRRAGVSDVLFLAGNGAGGFGTPVRPERGTVRSRITTASADFDSDGDLDLVVGQRERRVCRSAERRHRHLRCAHLLRRLHRSRRSIMADLNGDGRLDIAAAVGGVRPSQRARVS